MRAYFFCAVIVRTIKPAQKFLAEGRSERALMIPIILADELQSSL